MDKRQKLYYQLVDMLCDMGYPQQFGRAIAGSLGTEMTLERMIRYLQVARPSGPEEIADEMQAILTDRNNWRDKKINEFYNGKYNAWLNSEERYRMEDE